jgi:hypothetical protein
LRDLEEEEEEEEEEEGGIQEERRSSMSFKDAIATLNRFITTRRLLDLPSTAPRSPPPPHHHHLIENVNVRWLSARIARLNLLSNFVKVSS